MKEVDKIDKELDKLYDKIEELEGKKWELTKIGFKYKKCIDTK